MVARSQEQNKTTWPWLLGLPWVPLDGHRALSKFSPHGSMFLPALNTEETTVSYKEEDTCPQRGQFHDHPSCHFLCLDKWTEIPLTFLSRRWDSSWLTFYLHVDWWLSKLKIANLQTFYQRLHITFYL
jgi:hypothetical protein